MRVPSETAGKRKYESVSLGQEDPRKLPPGISDPRQWDEQDSAGAGAPIHVLCVDDEVNQLHYSNQLESLLSRCSNYAFNFIYINNGRDALEKLAINSQIQVAILDLDMPEVSGWDILEYLQALPHIRPIVASGKLFAPKEVSRAARHGAVYFPKPYNLQAIALLVNSLVETREIPVDRGLEARYIRELSTLEFSELTTTLCPILHNQPKSLSLDTYRQLWAAECIESLENGRIAKGKVSGKEYYYLKYDDTTTGEKKVKSVALGKDNPTELEDPRFAERIAIDIGTGKRSHRKS